MALTRVTVAGVDQGYCGSTATQAKVDLTEKDAQEIIAYRFTRNNPNLKIGKVKGTEDGFEVQIVTRKGEALVDRLLVEKDTGRIYRVYE
jgi:glycine cleavage system aminomethyltransferase T